MLSSLLLAVALLTPDPVAGRVVDPAGRPVAGAVITARTAEHMTLSVYTNQDGRFQLPDGGTGPLSARAAGFAPATIAAGQAGTVTLTPAPQPWRTLGANRLLGLLPEGPDRRAFILDCTGCHQFDAQTVGTPGNLDQLKDLATWRQRTEQMIGFAGARAGFPVMSPSRDAEETALMLSRHVTGAARDGLRPIPPGAPVGDAVVTEYFLPAPADLPHDVALTREGQVLITGMFTHRMYLLDPATGAFTIEPIPIGGANPRAVEVDANGAWWVLLGNPQRIARYANGEWTSWAVGMYGHSIGLTPDGRAWTNGHFTQDPEQIVWVQPANDSVRPLTVPSPPSHDGGRTIQYELRVAPDGAVWMSQLAGNRLIRFDPATGGFRRWDMPTDLSGPRRFDVAPDGRLWIPEYANNRLTRFDPATGRFQQFELPVPIALPYVARVDAARNVVWIGTGAADALLRFDITTETFTVYPTPSPGAIIRHLTIDPVTGTVWAANGASPARGPVQILKIEVRAD